MSRTIRCTPSRPAVALVFAATLALATGCGDDPRTPFTLQLNSQDVVQPAVDQIEIVITPSVAGQRFTMVPDMSFFGGQITSRITGAGQYAIFVEKPFVDANARQDPSAGAFVLDVPLLLSSTADQESVEDPTVEATFIRGSQRIGNGERFLMWPLQDGASVVLRVTCDRVSGIGPECSNNGPRDGTAGALTSGDGDAGSGDGNGDGG